MTGRGKPVLDQLTASDATGTSRFDTLSTDANLWLIVRLLVATSGIVLASERPKIGTIVLDDADGISDEELAISIGSNFLLS